MKLFIVYLKNNKLFTTILSKDWRVKARISTIINLYLYISINSDVTIHTFLTSEIVGSINSYKLKKNVYTCFCLNSQHSDDNVFVKVQNINGNFLLNRIYLHYLYITI